MRIALFGATGRVGSRLLEYALADGHTVRALARDPTKLEPLACAGLTVITGDVLDHAAVHATIFDADAVISTLGGDGLQVPCSAIIECFADCSLQIEFK